MPVCQGCGASYEGSFQFCPHCGRSKPEPQHVKVEISMDASHLPGACPQCGLADKTQKVSAIIAAGTSERDQTALAARLSFPQPPREPQQADFEWNPFDGLGGKILIGAIYITTVFVAFAVFNSDKKFWVGFADFFCIPSVVTGLAMFGLGWFVNEMREAKQKFTEAHQKYEDEMKLYQAAHAEWETLYYCGRDDVVYTQARREVAPARNAVEACLHWAASRLEQPVNTIK